MDTDSSAVPDRAEALATTFADLAGIIYACDDIDEVYAAVCSAAPGLITGCDHASVMLCHDGRFFTGASSDEVARYVDGLERELGEGPCVDAIEDKTAYNVPDLTSSNPWSKLTERLLIETPVRGSAGFRMMVDDKKVGALNLFADKAGAFTSTSVNEATVLASFISVALTAAHERQSAASLRDGLLSNREIGMAVGLLMAFHKVNSEQAFEILRKTSQDMNIKLVEVARQLVQHQNSRR